MRISLQPLRTRFDRYAPAGTPQRKVLQILSVVFLIEGISVLIVFSYLGPWLGLISIAFGALLMAGTYSREPSADAYDSPIGIRLLNSAVRTVGGPYVLSAIGVAVIAMTLTYNVVASPRPELGDIDTIVLLFGGILLAYPLASKKYGVETAFATLFVFFVVIFMALPQIAASLSQSETSSQAGSWYVHYMLAAPFAWILDVVGVPSEASGNLVSLTFKDGTTHVLSISAYCAGLYSFSIFLSAFFSFVLVLERLSRRLSILTLLAGLVIAYLGNLFRMVIIGLVGYFYGIDSMLWAHRNVGWIIFLAWSALFWWIVLDRVTVHQRPAEKTEAD